jgi:hypothetical protein
MSGMGGLAYSNWGMGGIAKIYIIINPIKST